MILLIDDNYEKRLQRLKESVRSCGLPCVTVNSTHACEFSGVLAAFVFTSSESYLNTVSLRCGRTPLLCVNESGNRIYNKDVVFYDNKSCNSYESFIFSFIKDKYGVVPGEYSVGSLKIADSKVSYGINPIKLTSTELWILILLTVCRNVWISEKNIEKICFDKRSGSCRVPVHICNINKKFRNIAGHSIIQSKRRIGYKAGPFL